MFVVKAWRLPKSEAPEKCLTWVVSSLTRKHSESLARNKPSSSFQTFIIYGFIELGPGWKSLAGTNLLVYLASLSETKKKKVL